MLAILLSRAPPSGMRNAGLVESASGQPAQRPVSSCRTVAALLDGGARRVGVIGFRELVSSVLSELAAQGLELFDLEDDVGAFTVALPRIRVVPIEQFDPWTLLR